MQADEFWHYALDVYQQEGVKQACLDLQDKMQLNVNLILAMMYLCKHGLMYRYDDFSEVEQAIAESEKKLKHHRRKRRGLKKIDESLYEKALSEELTMEKAQQAIIVEYSNGLVFQHIPNTSVLRDQLAALCLRQLTRLRPARSEFSRPRGTQTLSDEILQAISVLGVHV
jgi:uncharacterized protein (TIGR02444 family)